MTVGKDSPFRYKVPLELVGNLVLSVRFQKVHSGTSLNKHYCDMVTLGTIIITRTMRAWLLRKIFKKLTLLDAGITEDDLGHGAEHACRLDGAARDQGTDRGEPDPSVHGG